MAALDIDQLRTFLSVLEHGSFSRAADAMRVGQSTVSFHIKALETAVAARLLDRRGGRVRPTASGTLLRRYALRIVSLRDEALARLRAQEAGHAGSITIAASTIAGEYLLPPALADFRNKHPRVRVIVHVSDSSKALATLLAQECDIALVGTQVRDRRIVSQAFAEDEVVLVCRPSNRFSSSTRLSSSQLRKAPLILREEGSGTRQAVGRFLARNASSRADHAPVIQVGSTEAAKRCALHGLGFAFVSRFAVADDIASGRLAVRGAAGLPVRRRFYAARLKNVTPPAAALEFLSLLVQKYR